MKPELDKVRLIELPHQADERGVLAAVEGLKDVPFEIRRVFYMYGTPRGTERGGHAHKDTQQLVIAVAGQFSMELSDGAATRHFTLDRPTHGLYMPPMVFARLYDFSPGAVCLVAADTHYDKSKSLRTWQAFVAALAERPRA
jgi:dTDP-4-dehydrorhamnose 3,5-epimerase-like enzyme